MKDFGEECPHLHTICLVSKTSQNFSFVILSLLCRYCSKYCFLCLNPKPSITCHFTPVTVEFLLFGTIKDVSCLLDSILFRALQLNDKIDQLNVLFMRI